MESGSRIANYEIVRLIGRGGMSEVYEAIQIGTGRPIALKLLGPRAEDPRHVERLQLEGYALARIRHPNVVIVYDAGMTDGQAWIAMDLLEGQSMRDFLWQKGRLPLPQVLAYIGAICDGLESAHRLNIIHRDMKPENVFLTYDGGLKIVDFGNAKFLNSGLVSADPLRVFGTAAYMSPEQLGARQSVGPRSDLYAVGLMMYEMLLGRHAYSQGPNPYDLPPSIELCRLQIEEEPPPLATVEPRIPAFVSDFVARLTSKDPDLRPESAYLCGREARDMHDLIVRDAHSHGLAPASIPLTAPAGTAGAGSRGRVPASPLDALRASSTGRDRAVTLRPTASPTVRPRRTRPRMPWKSIPAAVGVGVVAGVALFGVLSVVRHVRGRESMGFAAPGVPRAAAPGLPSTALVGAAAPRQPVEAPVVAPEAPSAPARSVPEIPAPPSASAASPAASSLPPPAKAVPASPPVKAAPVSSPAKAAPVSPTPAVRHASAPLVAAPAGAPAAATPSTPVAAPSRPSSKTDKPHSDPYAPVF